jgi:hypothetical protein
MPVLTRSVLLRRALIVGTALLLAAPAAATASVSPSLGITPGAVSSGSTTATLSLDYNFNPSSGDSPLSFDTLMSPGLLLNASIDNGACLTASAPQLACQIGTGTATATSASWNGTVGLYLEQPPSPADIVGIALVKGNTTLAIADVTMRNASDVNGAGLDVDFSGLPKIGLSELKVMLGDVRTPTSCPSTPLNVILTARDQLGMLAPQASAPLSVTGCASLAYRPSLAVHAVKDANDSGTELITSVSQQNAGSESATQAVELSLPPSIQPNTLADAVCLFGSPCAVGSATASSPLLPASLLSNGTVTLSGTFLAPALTISFPAVNLSLSGAIDTTNDLVTFANMPDFPLSALTVDLTGPGNRKAFQTTCAAGNLTAKLTPRDGNPAVSSSTPVTFTNCPPPAPPPKPPTLSGQSLTGLTTGQPKLRFTVRHGANAPNIASLSIAPAAGLTFKRCRVKKGRCNGLALVGAQLRSVTLAGGRLAITLAAPAPRVSVTVSSPVLSESTAFLKRARRHKVKGVMFALTVVDAAHTSSALVLAVKP